MLGFEREYERSRIARLAGLALHPDFRGCGLADEAARRLGRHLVFDLGYHRLQLEIYGFNERAIRHAERVGYVREGVKRKAYRRHGEWVDGVMYALIREDYAPGIRLLHEHVERFNDGVRSGDFGPMLEHFAVGAELCFRGAPAGLLQGREAIAAAYRAQPPGDEVRVLDAAERGALATAGYAWARAPETRAGELLLEPSGDQIKRLVVTLE